MSSDTATLGLGKGRVEALSDGIFATVMTVLVLSLSVPIVASSSNASQVSADLSSYLAALVPDIIGYVLSFLILAVMWVSHHNVFHYVKRVDRRLIWLNITFLLAIGFVPFSTALIGRYPLLQLPVIIYGGNVVGIAVAMLAFLTYALRHDLITRAGHDGAVVRRIVERWKLGILVYATAMAASIVSTEISLLIYAVVLGFFVLQSALGFTPGDSKT